LRNNLGHRRFGESNRAGDTVSVAVADTGSGVSDNDC
jgi:hypothetical protein